MVSVFQFFSNSVLPGLLIIIIVEECLWRCSVGLVFLLEDLLQDVLALLNQVLEIFLDLGLVLTLKTFEDVFKVTLTFLELFSDINFGQTEIGVFFLLLFRLLILSVTFFSSSFQFFHDLFAILIVVKESHEELEFFLRWFLVFFFFNFIFFVVFFFIIFLDFINESTIQSGSLFFSCWSFSCSCFSGCGICGGGVRCLWLGVGVLVLCLCLVLLLEDLADFFHDILKFFATVLKIFIKGSIFVFHVLQGLLSRFKSFLDLLLDFSQVKFETLDVVFRVLE